MTRSQVFALSGFLVGAVVGFACGGSGIRQSNEGTGTAGNGTGAAGGGAPGAAGANGATTPGGEGGAVSGGGVAGAMGGAGTGGAAGGGVTGGATGGSVTGGTTGTGITMPGVVTTPTVCPVVPAQCSDGVDNDGDGKIDLDDPECSSPCDNNEGSFATGISGDNIDDLKSCQQDCFFDGNSGHGDDGCRWDLRCDSSRKDAQQCPYMPDRTGIMCPAMQSQMCFDKCRTITPNGCDCFGCCTVAGKDFAIRLSPTCSTATLDDPEKCPRCTQTSSCINTCEKCEICVGKPSPDPSCPSLPPPGTGGSGGTADGGAGGTGGTTQPPPSHQCDMGLTSCGSGGQVPADGCPSGYYCLTGCCVRLIP
jgi:hypothetical protein